MYNIGTVTTTANSTKVTGTNTKWKDNNSRVSAEQIILIVNGTTAYINSIQSIQSDTELTLSFPAPVAVKNGPYNILTTMVNSVSDAANKIVAMNVANVQFSDIVNRLATETGVIEVVLPDGTKKSMKTFAEMDKQLDGKLDKAGGQITKNDQALAIKVAGESQANYIGFLDASGYRRGLVGYGNTTDDFAISNTRSGITLKLTADGKALIGSAEIVKVGDFGIGKKTGVTLEQNGVVISDYRINGPAYCYGGANSDSYNKGNHTLFNIFAHSTGNYGAQFGFAIGGKSDFGFRMINNNTVLDWCTIYHTGNTTKDAQGNLRAASPIVKVFADHIEPNEEAEGVVLEKLGVGRYKLKGVLGMNSDASWGGFNGGIVIPKGINGLELVWADYKVLADGDIILETHYRKHSDLPPPVVLNRLIAYPEFMDENGNELESYTPCDIPNGHWIDIRVQMPSDSIYNQKQAEAERLAKIEAERLAEMDIDV
ncbi:hypothetical protein MMK73_003267 [Providencia rettgeri]